MKEREIKIEQVADKEKRGLKESKSITMKKIDQTRHAM